MLMRVVSGLPKAKHLLSYQKLFELYLLCVRKEFFLAEKVIARYNR